MEKTSLIGFCLTSKQGEKGMPKTSLVKIHRGIRDYEILAMGRGTTIDGLIDGTCTVTVRVSLTKANFQLGSSNHQ